MKMISFPCFTMVYFVNYLYFEKFIFFPITVLVTCAVRYIIHCVGVGPYRFRFVAVFFQGIVHVEYNVLMGRFHLIIT